MAPVVLAWWMLARAPLARRVATCATFALAAFLVVLPWLARNQRELGAFTLRTNLGVEAMVGNNPQATGYFQAQLHPSYNAQLFERYRALGEVGYGAWAREQAVAWVRANPRRFLELSLHRASIFWFSEPLDHDPRREGDLAPAADPKSWVKGAHNLVVGVLGLGGAIVLVQRRRIGLVLAAILLLFPLPYYLTHFLERYRFPIEPVLVLLAAVLLVDLRERWAARRMDRATARG